MFSGELGSLIYLMIATYSLLGLLLVGSIVRIAQQHGAASFYRVPMSMVFHLFRSRRAKRYLRVLAERDQVLMNRMIRDKKRLAKEQKIQFIMDYITRDAA